MTAIFVRGVVVLDDELIEARTGVSRPQTAAGFKVDEFFKQLAEVEQHAHRQQHEQHDGNDHPPAILARRPGRRRRDERRR